MWTTCPLCLGSGHACVERDGRLVWEDECPVCYGDGGIPVLDEEDDPAAIDDVDVKDED